MGRKKGGKGFSLKRFLKKRNTVQMLAALLTNIHLPNYLKGVLYNGPMKRVCVPGLNCYSCPGAAGACPIGSFQAVTGSSKFGFSYYITGVLIFFGVMLGRFICGFLCPFGWFQDLLHKIPTKKFGTERLKPLRYLKYLVLIAAVWILPALITNGSGMGSPYFCKYICPQGALEGAIPLALVDKGIRAALGVLFARKACILVFVIVLSILLYRPFCKYLCPLGAFYSLFNKISLLNYHVDRGKCIACGKCSRACKMDVDITASASHLECIRCGACKDACPTNAISIHWGLKNPLDRKEADNTGKKTKIGEKDYDEV